MSVDSSKIIRQYVFDHGPNYTDSPYILTERELAESENVLWDGALKTIPGAERIVSTTFNGTSSEIVGAHQYAKKDGSSFFLAVNAAGTVGYESGGAWTIVETGLSTQANTYWDWITFNNTLIALSGSNVPQKWFGTGGFDPLGGSPPSARYGIAHATDFVVLAGHTNEPSQLRYCDSADANSWPVGNTLEVGRNEGTIITGLQRFGDTTAIFKESSIWLLSGSTPSDFSLNPTPADVGCIAPDSITLTDAGIFYWSEAGPALFNGFKSTILGKRLRRLLEDEVDFSEPLRINAAYYPFKKQVLISYQRPGQTMPDRMLLLDLYRFSTDEDDKQQRVFWPITAGGATAMATAKDSTGRRRIYLGHHNGFVTVWDQGITFNNDPIVPRVRTRMLTVDNPAIVSGMRAIDVRATADTSNIVIKTAVDGADTFTTHPNTPVSLVNSGKSIKQFRLQGDGGGYISVGNVHQLEFTTNAATGFTLRGYETALEPLGNREPR